VIGNTSDKCGGPISNDGGIGVGGLGGGGGGKT